MKKLTISIILLTSFIVTVYSQQEQTGPRNSITVMFYNVENLFDTTDDPDVSDEEFTPGSQKLWDETKYAKKVVSLSETIASVGGKELPGLIGLCEIENRKVLEDLVSSQKLKRGDYSIIHYESRDERGIDVALLFRKEKFTNLASRAIPVVFSADATDRTRDILYAKLKADDGLEYHVFVNHWPSRNPTAEESETKRISAALALRKEVDQILNSDNKARIIILGDFNDEPTNRSIFQILNATGKRKNVYYRDLYNLMFDLHNTTSEGTITYRDTWQLFDQIIVSPSILTSENGYRLSYTDGKIFRNDKVLVRNPADGMTIINRTYGGNSYLGGISDHLPVYAVMWKEKK